MSLHVVSDDEVPTRIASIQGEQQPEYRDRSQSHKIPDFEGQQVDFTKAKITSVALEIDDAVYRTDQIVTLLVEARVVGVQHIVNDKTGKMERVHNLKALDSVVVAMDFETLKSELASSGQ